MVAQHHQSSKSFMIYATNAGHSQTLVCMPIGLFATLKPGDYFGEMGLIDGEPRSANVSTIEACSLLRLGAPEFEVCLQSNFRIVRTVLKGLSQRLRDLNSRSVVQQR
jgi:CRP-like cAMP-binding protein